MKRREFITLLGGAAAAWPLAARAQQPERMRRIGVLMGFAESDLEGHAFFAAFREGLEKLGWAEGRNFRIDTRWATPATRTRRRFAKELVALQPELILSSIQLQLQRRWNRRTLSRSFSRSLPIRRHRLRYELFAPGRQCHRFHHFEPTMAGKWLELLKEIAPRVNRAPCCLIQQRRHIPKIYLNPFKAAAASFAVEAIVSTCS